ncbi:MAG: RHS repeat-associated core domain-containing protein [Pseudomonadota bacterium]
MGGSAGTVTTAVSYVHNDHLGTPQTMTDETGSVVWRAAHDPFGKADIDISSSQSLNIRFPGQYYDHETGLHYNYFRYYDSVTGRYITSDLLGIMLDNPSPEMFVAGEIGYVELPYEVAEGYINHLYAYVDSNPLLYTDFYGLHHKSSHRWKPRPGSISLGDYISDVNGNLWPGTKPQDWRCSLGPVIGELGDACFPERCFDHDQCYEDNECNVSSWIPTILGGEKSCNKCNRDFFN